MALSKQSPWLPGAADGCAPSPGVLSSWRSVAGRSLGVAGLVEILVDVGVPVESLSTARSEITADVCEFALGALTLGASSGYLGGLAALGRSLGDRTRGAICPACQDSKGDGRHCGCCGAAAREALGLVPRPLIPARLWGITHAVEELAAALLHSREGCTLAFPLLMATLLPATSATPLLVLSGLAPALQGCASAILMAGGYSMWKRHPEEVNRVLQTHSFVALALCSAVHLGIALVGYVPLPFLHDPQNLVALHFVEDFVAVPMLLLNLGFLTGTPSSMLPCISYSVLSTAGAIGFTLGPEEYARMIFGGVSICCWALNVNCIMQLPPKATAISASNQFRCGVIVDLMVVSWSLYPMTQWLGFVGVLSPQSQLNVLALLDLLGKLGVSHIMLRSKSVLQYAARYNDNRSAPQDDAGHGYNQSVPQHAAQHSDNQSVPQHAAQHSDNQPETEY